MLARYMGMTLKSQSYLFTFGLILTLLGMVLTNMWLPMVVGAILMTALSVEAWIRVAHIAPMRNELRAMHEQIEQLKVQLHNKMSS